MKSFEIIIKNSKCVILSTSYVNPLSDLNIIEKELNKKQFNGEVCFDLLLSNGKDDRFIKANYNSGFDLSSFFPLKDISPSILELCKFFYEENLNLVDNSILTKAQKFLLRKGKLL